MICVSIGRSRHKHVKAEHRHLAEQGAKLVELRLDYITTRINIARLLRDRPCAVVATCRRERDGGKFTGTEEQRLMLLRAAIAEGVDYVDLEEDVAGQVPRYGQTKRIVSYHNFRHTPDNLREVHSRLSALDADVVKIATMANNPHDNLRMLEMLHESESPTVGMCMGDMGTPSRILASRFGAPFTYATFHHERALAPGQLSFQQMNDIYFYDQIDRETDVYGVIADPIGHSYSPLVHNAAFRAAGINAVYVPFRVPSEALEPFVEDVPRLAVKGLSVTIPHKESIAGFLSKVDPPVKAISAVNTVLFTGAGVVGYNTDYKAAMDCLENAIGQVGAQPSPLKGRRILVLGAGGVARAVMYGINNRGGTAVITNRTRERADQLAKEFGGQAIDWEDRHRAQVNVVVNCTPIGMHPNVDDSPYEQTHMKRGVVIFDTVYNPETTLMIKSAKEMGCPTITGVEMFVRQAALQFFLFTGIEGPAKLMRETLKRAIGPVRFSGGSGGRRSGVGGETD